MRRSLVLSAALVVLATACASSSSSKATPKPGGGSTTAPIATPVAQVVADVLPAGAKKYHLEIGPLTIAAGQNSNNFSARRVPQPDVDGWIVGMTSNLRFADGTVPPVDVLHLHHGVWVNLAAKDTTFPALPERLFAAGEEKTRIDVPAGYGYAYKASNMWLVNYMIHSSVPKPLEVWMTYDIDMIPASSPNAKGITAVRPIWMDVENGHTYPVFDVLRGSGQNGEFTFPDDAVDPYGAGPALNRWESDADGTLVVTAGHLHPGGLRNDLWLTRKGAKGLDGHTKPGAPDTAHLFRSDANYFEPAGSVSWDVAMTATPENWRVAVHKGDVLSTTTTYDSATGSWYEAMGIMVFWMASGPPSGADPFTTAVDVPGAVSHGHLPENDNHGGTPDPEKYQDVTKLPDQPVSAGSVLPIADFTYRGDMSAAASVPTVAQGGSLTFRNDDAADGIWHTITSCAAPCDRSTGIAFPLADGPQRFDSRELGLGDAPAAGTITWSTPKDLPPGTYTYFCRIHPFMRGAFRVAPSN